MKTKITRLRPRRPESLPAMLRSTSALLERIACETPGMPLRVSQQCMKRAIQLANVADELSASRRP